MISQTSNAARGNESADFDAGRVTMAGQPFVPAGEYWRCLPSFTAGGTVERRTSSLPKWRLRRALDFIEANLEQPIGLADVAASAGLTRMHFAAQFRSTTGYSPHAYLLRRRIERAQRLLRSSALSVLDVALSCGFGSHAHFTTVFGRMVGEPPTSWRTRMRDEGAIAEPAVPPRG